MKRIVKRPGDIFRFPLTDPGQYGYCQWLADGTARVFLASVRDDLTPSQVLALPRAFRVLVFRDTPNQYGWSKAGKAEVPVDFQSSQTYAKRDALSGALSRYSNGIETPATTEELRGLETLAVWAHPHIVERLEAMLHGRESAYLRVIRVVV